jgi:NTE family protein
VNVGLVLGGGGVLGATWISAALEVLHEETSWDPNWADEIVGTSAGSVVAACVAAGLPPEFMSAYSAGLPLDALADEHVVAAAAADPAAGASFRLQKALPRPGPGSWRLALSSVIRPRGRPALAAISGWLPRGVLTTDPVRNLVRRLAPRGWAHHPNLRVVACDYATGRRAVFGPEHGAAVELAEAVAASCAIPGIYHPVTVGGRSYIDGGVWSRSNLDVVSTSSLDAVICLSPMSVGEELPARTARQRLVRAVRLAVRRRLYEEMRRVEAAGTEVLVLQPLAADAAAMGLNTMRRGLRASVREAARRSVASQLRQRSARRLLRRIETSASQGYRADLSVAARAPGAASTRQLRGGAQPSGGGRDFLAA